MQDILSVRNLAKDGRGGGGGGGWNQMETYPSAVFYSHSMDISDEMVHPERVARLGACRKGAKSQSIGCCEGRRHYEIALLSQLLTAIQITCKHSFQVSYCLTVNIKYNCKT